MSWGQQLQLKEANLTQKIAREKDLEKQTSQVLWQSEHLEKSLQADLSELDEIGEGVLLRTISLIGMICAKHGRNLLISPPLGIGMPSTISIGSSKSVQL